MRWGPLARLPLPVRMGLVRPVGGGAPPGPSQLYMLRRAGLADDTLETSTAAPSTSTMTFLIWVKAITAHDATAPSLLGWGAPSAGIIDPGVLIRFNPASSDRLEALIGRAGTAANAQVNLSLPGSATDITTLSDFLVWLTLNGTTARLGVGDPAGGVLASGAVTGGVDTGSTIAATVFGRYGVTDRGMAGTMAVAVLGEVLSDAAIAAAAAAGATGPAAAAAASSAPLWCPRPLTGLADGDPITTAADVVDTEGTYSHTLTSGTARLKAAA